MELNRKYTFRTVGYLTINGEDVNTLEIELSPMEIGEIYEWFKLRDMKWIGHIPLEFRKHSPELYDKLYQELVNLCNESDADSDYLLEIPDEEIEYDCTIDPCDDECAWGCLLWPIQLFEEMKISVPNASIWVTDIDAKSDFDSGIGYPIYLEENYLEELRIILEATVWNDNFKKWSVDVNHLDDKHSELKKIIEHRLKDVLVSTYNYEEKDFPTLRFSLYQLSIDRKYNPLTGK